MESEPHNPRLGVRGAPELEGLNRSRVVEVYDQYIGWRICGPRDLVRDRDLIAGAAGRLYEARPGQQLVDRNHRAHVPTVNGGGLIDEMLAHPRLRSLS